MQKDIKNAYGVAFAIRSEIPNPVSSALLRVELTMNVANYFQPDRQADGYIFRAKLYVSRYPWKAINSSRNVLYQKDTSFYVNFWCIS